MEPRVPLVYALVSASSSTTTEEEKKERTEEEKKERTEEENKKLQKVMAGNKLSEGTRFMVLLFFFFVAVAEGEKIDLFSSRNTQ